MIFLQNLTAGQSQCLPGGNGLPLSTAPFLHRNGRYCVMAREAMRLAQLAGIGTPQARVVMGQEQPITSTQQPQD